MQIDKSMNRLAYTIAKGNKPNQTDANAFNEVVDWINFVKEERLARNHHFCKMTMYVYNQLLLHYEGSNITAEKEIQNILKEPLKGHYERFKLNMDMFRLNDFFNHYEFKDTVKPQSIETLREVYKENSDKAKDPVISDSFAKFMKEHMFSNEAITEKLNNFLSELLVRYENKEHDLHCCEHYADYEDKGCKTLTDNEI